MQLWRTPVLSRTLALRHQPPPEGSGRGSNQLQLMLILQLPVSCPQAGWVQAANFEFKISEFVCMGTNSQWRPLHLSSQLSRRMNQYDLRIFSCKACRPFSKVCILGSSPSVCALIRINHHSLQTGSSLPMQLVGPHSPVFGRMVTAYKPHTNTHQVTVNAVHLFLVPQDDVRHPCILSDATTETCPFYSPNYQFDWVSRGPCLLGTASPVRPMVSHLHLVRKGWNHWQHCLTSCFFMEKNHVFSSIPIHEPAFDHQLFTDASEGLGDTWTAWKTSVNRYFLSTSIFSN